MTKVFFQDANGNAPIVAAFVPFREARAVLREAIRELRAQGVAIRASDSQRIIAENGAKYWLG
jgi:hypothetical protein